MNLPILREQTREQHEATEAMLPLTGPGLDRARYEQVLQAFHRMMQGWERWAAEHAPGPLAAVVNERRRVPLLERDLRFFGLSPAADPALEGYEDSQGLQALNDLLAEEEASSEAYRSAFLGAMYVIEGSTLGGQYIARHVEDLFRLSPGEGDAYFRGYGERTGAMWNAFRQELAAVPDEHAGRVIAAANLMFEYVQGVFLRSGVASDPLTVAGNAATPHPPARESSSRE